MCIGIENAEFTTVVQLICRKCAPHMHGTCTTSSMGHTLTLHTLIYFIFNTLTHTHTHTHSMTLQLVTACNDGARKMERTEQLHEIHKKLYFGKLKPFPLVSVSRQLERRGTLVLLQVEQKLFGKRKITKTPLYLFVFTDYVIIAKRKKE